MIQIKRAKPRDFLEVARLDREAWTESRFSEYIPDGEHAWRLWMEHAVVFCAWEAEQLVGAVLVFPTLTQSLFCLHKVFVDRQFRGQGIGSRLFEAALAELNALRASCFLTVDPVNENAIRLYEKWGFTERQFVAGYYREHEDRLVLTRRCP